MGPVWERRGKERGRGGRGGRDEEGEEEGERERRREEGGGKKERERKEMMSYISPGKHPLSDIHNYYWKSLLKTTFPSPIQGT